MPCSPSAAARRQLRLDSSRAPATEAASTIPAPGSSDSSSSGLQQAAAGSQDSERTVFSRSHSDSAAASPVQAVHEVAATPANAASEPLPARVSELPETKFAEATPVRYEVHSTAGQLWQPLPAGDTAAIGSLQSTHDCDAPSATAKHAAPAATPRQQHRDASSAEPSWRSPEDVAAACSHPRMPDRGEALHPVGGREVLQLRQEPIARAVSLREAYGGSPMGQHSAAMGLQGDSRPHGMASGLAASVAPGLSGFNEVPDKPGEHADAEDGHEHAFRSEQWHVFLNS